MKMQSGQALVVVLLVLAVVLTLGVSIASRTVTEVNISTVEDESSRALDAAEAGAEAELGRVATEGVKTQVGSSSSTYTVSSVDVGNGESVSPPEQFKAGEIVTIFLSGHDANGNLIYNDPNAYDKNMHICWGNEGTPNADPTTPAVEVRLYYYNPTTLKFGVAGNAYDTRPLRAARNGFTSPNNSGGQPCNLDGRNYPFFAKNLSLTIDLNMPSDAKPLAMRVRLIYSGSTGHYLGFQETGVTGTHTFPYQGKSIVSAGSSAEAVRKVSVFQRYDDLPPLFDDSLSSATDLNKP